MLMCGLERCDVFDGTHSLQRHWWVKDVIHISDDLKEMFTPVQTLVFSRCWLMDVFIRLSFWRHPFTAEHPSLRHWRSAKWWICNIVWLSEEMERMIMEQQALEMEEDDFQSHGGKWFFNRSKKISKKEPSSRSTSARSPLSERL